MKMNWIGAAFVMVGLAALTACDSTGTAGGGGAGGGTSTGGAGGGMGGSGGSAPTCASMLTSDFSGWSESAVSQNADAQALWDCACGSGTSCALVCNDPAHPSFCAGTAPVAGGQCETCLKKTGSSGCGDQLATCQAN